MKVGSLCILGNSRVVRHRKMTAIAKQMFYKSKSTSSFSQFEHGIRWQMGHNSRRYRQNSTSGLDWFFFFEVLKDFPPGWSSPPSPKQQHLKALWPMKASKQDTSHFFERCQRLAGIQTLGCPSTTRRPKTSTTTASFQVNISSQHFLRFRHLPARFTKTSQ